MHPALHRLAENPALPPELVDRLIAAADADLAADLACRPDLSRAQILALARCEAAAVRLAYDGRLTADDVDPAAQPRVALALLEQHAGRPEWARLLAASPLPEHREKLAACPNLPSDVMQTLARDPDIRVGAELALQAPAQIAAQLARHLHAEVRRAVACNEATPPTALAALLAGRALQPARSCLVCGQEPTPYVHDPGCDRTGCTVPPGASCDGSHASAVHDIQDCALRNPATPLDATAEYACHPSMLLRRELAARTDLLPQTYEQLATDPVPWVRSTLAENPAISDALIRTLATDQGYDVQRRLAHHPNVPLDVLAQLARTARLSSALLPRIASASDREVEQLADSPNPALRALLAQRRDLPPRIRDLLATDPDAKVVKAIAPHPGLSDTQLRAMIARHGVRVLAKAAANPEATAALPEDIAQHQPPAQKALREIARHRNASAAALLSCLADHQARPLAARHPALPPETAVQLLDDEDWHVAHAAAANPSLPRTAISRLIP